MQQRSCEQHAPVMFPEAAVSSFLLHEHAKMCHEQDQQHKQQQGVQSYFGGSFSSYPRGVHAFSGFRMQTTPPEAQAENSTTEPHDQ